MSVKLSRIPGVANFRLAKSVDPSSIQDMHEAYLKDTRSMETEINKASVIDLGEKDADFNGDHIGLSYADGQQIRFTFNGNIYRGEVVNGEVWCSVLTRISDL